MFGKISNFNILEWQALITNPGDMTKTDQKRAIEFLELAKNDIAFSPEAEYLLLILQMGKILHDRAQIGQEEGRDGISEGQEEMYYKAMISLREIINDVVAVYAANSGQ